LIRRWRRYDDLGGRLEASYPPQASDPYTGHVASDVEEPVTTAPPPRVGFRERIGSRLGRWRRAWMPLPDEIVEDYLGHGERVIHNDHPSFRAFLIEHALLLLALLVAVIVFVGIVLDGSLLAVLVTFALLGVILLVLMIWRLSDRYTSYVITNVRIMRISGVIGRSVHSIPWMRVTDLSFEQSWRGRIFGYATLHIESANEESGLRKFEGVSKPALFNKYLSDMVVAKQGPIAPGWEELGEAGPPGWLVEPVGLRDRVREIRRRRREQRAEADAERVREFEAAPARRLRRRRAGRGRATGERRGDDARRERPAAPAAERPAPPPGAPAVASDGERGPDRDPRRVFVDDDTTQQIAVGDRDAAGGRDPLRENPESSLPWGRE
jgi:membrane protein YdbS with pleckstrin-like domain